VTELGCPSAPSSATNVTVNTVPTPTITPGGPTTFCQGGSVLLTSSSASGNQWYRNGIALGGETGQTYMATTSGNYAVTVTNSGCTTVVVSSTAVTVNPKPDATITVVSPMFSGASATASVNVSCAIGTTFAWSITGGTITAGAGTSSITFTAGPAGTLTLQVTVTTAAGCSDTKTANVTVQTAAFGAPPFLQATAASTTSASLQWAVVNLAATYEVHRSTDNVSYTLRGTTAATTFAEGSLTPSTTYFYKVRAIKADTTASAFSAIDPLTTVTFTNEPLTSCPPVIIRAAHITQLRTAVNIARASIGLSAFSFTDPSLAVGAAIKAIHVSQLRTALGPVLTAIGVTPTYTDPTITTGTTKVKAAHIRELRDRIK
jgi:PKD-like domain